jgi:hypothetical protein
LSGGEIASLLLRFSSSEGDCLCLRGNVRLRFIEKNCICLRRRLSLLRWSVSPGGDPSVLQRRDCLCLRRRLLVSQKERVFVSEGDRLCLRGRLSPFCQTDIISFSKKGSVCLRGRSSLTQEEVASSFSQGEIGSVTEREATFVSGRSCLAAFHKENSLLATRRLLLSQRECPSSLQKRMVFASKANSRC